MAGYLAEHSSVFFSVPKEPHFFATDMPGQQQMTELDRYELMFEGAGPQHEAVGEASVWYLYSSEAIANIKKYNPDARLVVMLRNPVDMVYSMHAQHLYSTTEHIESFADAWAHTAVRRETGTVNRERVLKNHFYDDIAAYGSQLERLYTYFPREQVHVILYDDFKQDTAGCYRDLLDFLELDDDGRTEFPVVNANNEHKHKWLGRLLQQPPAPLVNALRLVKRLLGIHRLGLIGKLDALNAQDVKRASLDDTLRQDVATNYAKEIDKLSALLGRDLSHWGGETRAPASESAPVSPDRRVA